MKIIYVIFALLFSNNLFCAPSEQEIKEFFTKLFAEIDAKKDNDNDFIQFYPYEKINKSDFKNVKLALKNKDLLEKLSNNDIHNYISYNFYNKKIISKNIINETKKRYKNNPNNDDCKYNIAIINYFNKNYLKAFIYLYDLAKKNYIRAQYSLSLIYKISYFFMPYSLTKMRLKEKNLIKKYEDLLKFVPEKQLQVDLISRRTIWVRKRLPSEISRGYPSICFVGRQAESTWAPECTSLSLSCMLCVV